MDKIYDIKNLTVTPKNISFDLQGEKVIVPLERVVSEKLSQSRIEQIQCFELTPSGYGIHWPALDEDLSIAGLLKIAGKENLIVKEIESTYLEEESVQKAS